MASKKTKKASSRGAKTIADIKRKSPPPARKERAPDMVAETAAMLGRRRSTVLDPDLQRADGWDASSRTRPSLNRLFNELGMQHMLNTRGARVSTDYRAIVIEGPAGAVVVHDESTGEEVSSRWPSFPAFLADVLARLADIEHASFRTQAQRALAAWMSKNGWAVTSYPKKSSYPGMTSVAANPGARMRPESMDAQAHYALARTAFNDAKAKGNLRRIDAASVELLKAAQHVHDEYGPEMLPRGVVAALVYGSELPDAV